MKVSDYVARFLQEQGVEVVFEMIGGIITHLIRKSWAIVVASTPIGLCISFQKYRVWRGRMLLMWGNIRCGPANADVGWLRFHGIWSADGLLNVYGRFCEVHSERV